MILVDFSPVVISNSYANMGDGDRPDRDEFREMVFATLATINAKNRDEYGEIVICMDNKPYWREEPFPHYKKNRKKMTDVHWDVIDEVKEVLKTRIAWKVLDIPGCEADDIIGTLVHEFHHRNGSEEFLIVSPDGDFKQLQIYPNVTQIDIGRGRVLEESNAREFLQEQIMCGQKKDAIPNILSDEDTLVNPDKRQKPMTAKKKADWIGLDPSFFCEGDMMKRYRLNEKLIDLSKIPDDIKQNIIYSYALAPAIVEGNLRAYFVEQRMAQMADRVRDFT